MTNIRINDNSYCEVTRERDPHDEWSGEDTYTGHSIESFHVVDDDDHCDISVVFDIDDGKDYYLLYAIYSTGDSFSRNDGEIALIDLYETKEMAEKNRQLIADNLKDEDNWSVILELEDGRVYSFHVPWKGYFEHLDEVAIERIRTGKKDSWRM